MAIKENEGMHYYGFGLGGTIIVSSDINGIPCILLKSLVHTMPTPEYFESLGLEEVTLGMLFDHFESEGSKIDWTNPKSYDAVLTFVTEEHRDKAYEGLKMPGYEKEAISVK